MLFFSCIGGIMSVCKYIVDVGSLSTLEEILGVAITTIIGRNSEVAVLLESQKREGNKLPVIAICQSSLPEVKQRSWTNKKNDCRIFYPNHSGYSTNVVVKYIGSIISNSLKKWIKEEEERNKAIDPSSKTEFLGYEVKKQEGEKITISIIYR